MTETNGWSTLAEAMRQAADRFERLAATDLRPPRDASLFVYPHYGLESVVNKALVDGIAQAFGVAANTKVEGRGASRRGEHRMEARIGLFRVHAYTEVPVPPTRAQTMAELQRENDELRARLAKGGQS